MPDAAAEKSLQSPPLVALAGWLVPGGGYWLIGQRTRAYTVGVTILAVFVLGILISGIRVVQAPDISGPGSLPQRVLAKPWFIGQVLAGPVGIGAAIISDYLAQSDAYGPVEAKARLAEIGTLYTAVAGMLNLLTIIDAAHRAGGEEEGKE
ncbi:MAG TPA: DUF6677 family protein [Tepidisphaeraceae bacterium]|nr:DUF6677 family protein [Tepidisphaeraceae bacterium]